MTWWARNVAALVSLPEGRPGRPSKSFTLEETKALVRAASQGRATARVRDAEFDGGSSGRRKHGRWARTTSLSWQTTTLGGARSSLSEFQRLLALAGEFSSPSMYGGPSGMAATPRPTGHDGRWRCHSGASTPRPSMGESRLPTGCGPERSGQDHGHVFASRVGTPLNVENVIRAFRIITVAAWGTAPGTGYPRR